MNEDKYQNLLDLIGELSVRINKIESSLREFEKERVNPKFEEIKSHIDEIDRYECHNRALIELNNMDIKELKEQIDYLKGCLAFKSR